jgi:hypothetical protein
MQTKENLTEHTRKDPKPNPKISHVPPKYPPYFETTSTRSRWLHLAGVSICNRTAADQLDVDCFAWVGSVFRPSGTLMVPGFPLMWGVHQGSRSKRSVWVVTVAAVETVTKRVKRSVKRPGVHRCRPVRLRKNRFTSPVAEGDGWTLISNCGWIEVQVHVPKTQISSYIHTCISPCMVGGSRWDIPMPSATTPQKTNIILIFSPYVDRLRIQLFHRSIGKVISKFVVCGCGFINKKRIIWSKMKHSTA